MQRYNLPFAGDFDPMLPAKVRAYLFQRIKRGGEMLYHVSYRAIRGSILYPRIPAQRAYGENNIIKRICFTTTIEKGLTSMPNGGKALKNLLYAAERTLLIPILHIYSINERDIEEGNLLSNEAVFKLVPDAIRNGEVWVINQKVKCKHEIIRVMQADIWQDENPKREELYEVTKINWELLKRLPKESPEKAFKKPRVDLRLILACIDQYMPAEMYSV
jgi:hypothetical protein